ncbi:MAG: AmmeMemoRadiSam system protein A [Motiliproteus sp.]|nr:AmmeMemoRadiSam system protein A [Motiliproteus sp.]MCW9051284.1 AmmeMemoRadiSam system protein A [Motiliproteus sp.]
MPFSELNESQQNQLLSLARQSIGNGLGLQPGFKVNLDDYVEALQIPAACFVTLTINGQLRGCIGTLEARDPLVEAVAYYAHSAAFSDTRFSPLSEADLDTVQIEISLLSPMEKLDVDSEHDLLQQLRPHVDGLWIEEGTHRATFLPQVWEKLPEPKQFLEQLKLKAGWSSDYWSENIQCYIYTVIMFEEK